MQRLIEAVREHAGTRAIVGTHVKRDVRKLCAAAESLCGTPPFAIGTKRFDKWARELLPMSLERGELVKAIADGSTIVRIVFDLGRQYERLVRAKEARKRR